MNTLNAAIPLLDHGFVRLVDSMGSDLSIVRNARCSYNAEWRTGEDAGKDEKLIHYLVKNKHTTPLECVTFTFDVKAPIFVFRQWHRHRTWAFNETSARYAEMADEFYVPELNQITMQSATNKQMRTQEQNVNAPEARRLIHDSCVKAFEDYKRLVGMGVPRELARGVLPVNTYSHMFATVNLNNLFKFIELRDHSHAQYEIQVYARAMRELARSVCPVAVAALESV